jgi:hypothetical protein
LTGLDEGVQAAGPSAAFAELRGGFELAAGRLEVGRHRLRIGSQAIELRIAGEVMAGAVLPALQHLREPEPAEGEPDLVVMAWDSAGSDTQLPDLPGVLDGAVGRWQYDGEVCLSFRMFESVVSALHSGRGEAIHCVADARQLAPYDIAHPLSEIFAWWLSRSGCYRVHAAAVGTAVGGVLLAGASGAGKSTSALTCLRAGMEFVGDDTVLVRADPPAAISLYNSGRADRDLLARYPNVFPRLELPSGEEKAVGFFPREAMTQEIPLRAVVLPRVVPGGTCRIGLGSRAAALLALAPWVVFHSPGGGGRALGSIRSLLAALPIHTLQIGDDLPQIPVLLSDLIEESVPCW